jgi:long-chain fatty acid transport protein
VAANWYNPAALLRQHGMQFQIGANYIPIGDDTDFTVTDAAYLLPCTGSTAPRTFAPEGHLGTPAHLYISHKLNDRIAWGVGLNNPYGLITEWKKLPVTLSARKSELSTWMLNPNVAFGIGERWSVAVGLDYMYADVSEFSRDIDQSGFLMLPPGTVVGRSNLTGDGDAWGYNVAVHCGGDLWSFGLTYRSELSPSIEGDLRFSGINPALAGFFPDSAGTAELNLPAQAAVGVAWHASDAWDVELDVAFAGWSSFERLEIQVENPALPDIVLEENWDDTFSYRIGTAWALTEVHELRFGAVCDEAPIPPETLRPSIPDGDRTGVSVGYGYASRKWNLDAYLMQLWFDDATAAGDPALKPPNPNANGVIDGLYESSTYLLGVTFNVRF